MYTLLRSTSVRTLPPPPSDFARFGDALLYPPSDRSPEHAVPDFGLQSFGRRRGRIDGGLGPNRLGLRAEQRGPGHLHAGQVDVPFLLAHGAADDQFLGTLVLLVGIRQLTLLDRDFGERGAPVILSLHDLGLSLTQLSFKWLGIHLRDDLPRFDGVSFIGKDRLDPARILGRDIDLFGFESAVAVREPGRQGGFGEYEPREDAANCSANERARRSVFSPLR